MNWTKQDITRIYNALADAESKIVFLEIDFYLVLQKIKNIWKM